MSSTFFQKDKDYCENTRSIDLMLDQFEKDRKSILKLLKENPKKLVEILWSNNSPVCKDDDCLFQMGKSMSLSIDDILEKKSSLCDSMFNYYICPQCKNMRRIIDFSKTGPDTSFILECGEKAGSSLYYNRVNISQLYLVLEKEPKSVKKAYLHPGIIELAKCSSAVCPLPTNKNGLDLLDKYSKMSYLGSDPFTNNILINWYLQEQISIPNISENYISWVCNMKGYNLFGFPDIGLITSFQDFPSLLTNTGKPSPTAKADDKTPISREVVLGIVVQLFAILHNLRKYDFSHGNPNTQALKFKNEPVSYITDGVHVTCPVNLILEDFQTSGCTVIENNIRLYSKSVVADEELKKRSYDPIIDNISVKNNLTVYRLKDPTKYVKSSLLFMYMKHLGLPVYSASFDAYAFMSVLMSERSFYFTMMSDKILSKFWRNMWGSDEDYQKVEERIQNHHENIKPVTSSDVLKILSGVDLRCDMIDFGWNTIKTF